MATIKDWLDKFKKIDNSNKMNSIVKEIVMRNKGQIIELQQIQLDKGLDREGDVVGTYAPSTELFARKSLTQVNESKKAGQPYNFNWTGRFINGIFIRYNRGKITFHSRGLGDADKKDWIIRNKLLGATEETARIINDEIILPELREAFKNKL